MEGLSWQGLRVTSRCYDADVSGRFLEQYVGDLSLGMYMTKGQTDGFCGAVRINRNMLL